MAADGARVIADEDRVEVTSDVVFGTGGGRDLKCDIYVPPAAKANGAAIVLVHGGAWRSGDRRQLRGYGIRFGREGYVCIAPEYRLTPESPWPAQIEDVKAAIRWTRANAAQYGIDPERIAIEGNSAGGHLALLAAGTPGYGPFEGSGGNPDQSTHVAVAIGVYAPTVFSVGERERGATHFASIDPQASATTAAAAGPVTHVTADYPPTLLLHGTKDTTVPPLASVRMYEALVAAGVPVELHMYAEAPHAFDGQRKFGRQAGDEMVLFLSRYLLGGRSDEPAPRARAATRRSTSSSA